MKKLNIGVMGAGGIAGLHLAGFDRMPELGRVVVCDPNPAALAARRKEWPRIETVENSDALFDDPGLDVIDVCTPHYLHYPLAMRALAAGKHVLTEKPMALRPAEAEEMLREAERRGRRLRVSLNQMFVPAHRKAKEMIDAGQLGRVTLAVWKMIGCELHTLNRPDHWKGDVEKAGGGALIDTGAHGAYIMLDLLGPAKRVSCFARRLVVEPANKGDDNTVALVEFASGALLAYAQTYTQTSEGWNERKYLYGTAGSLRIDDSEVPGRALRFHRPDDLAGAPVAVAPMSPLWQTSVALSVQHNLRVILGDAAPLYETQLALDAVRLIDALYASDRSGTQVSL